MTRRCIAMSIRQENCESPPTRPRTKVSSLLPQIVPSVFKVHISYPPLAHDPNNVRRSVVALRLGARRTLPGTRPDDGLSYGATFLINVPQFASVVRSPPGIYSVANQRFPSLSAVAAE